MGTNFYWRDESFDGDRDNPEVHIGKRSAAGLYCWDCRVTLCSGGNDEVHMGRSYWHSACPKCCRPPTPTDGLKEGAAAVELGFAEPREDRPTGVRCTASFSWAQEPSEVRARCERQMDERIVEDEYGDTYTGREFLRMLASNCAIEFTRHVGQWFS